MGQFMGKGRIHETTTRATNPRHGRHVVLLAALLIVVGMGVNLKQAPASIGRLHENAGRWRRQSPNTVVQPDVLVTDEDVSDSIDPLESDRGDLVSNTVRVS